MVEEDGSWSYIFQLTVLTSSKFTRWAFLSVNRDGKLCLGGLHLSVPHWEVVNYTTVFCFIIGEVDAEAGKLFFVEYSTHLGVESE